jgi:hypothetical protein
MGIDAKQTCRAVRPFHAPVRLVEGLLDVALHHNIERLDGLSSSTFVRSR